MTVLKQKDNFFFTTRKLSGIYSYMLEAMKLHAEVDLKEKLKFYEYAYNKRFSFNLFFNVINKEYINS